MHVPLIEGLRTRVGYPRNISLQLGVLAKCVSEHSEYSISPKILLRGYEFLIHFCAFQAIPHTFGGIEVLGPSITGVCSSLYSPLQLFVQDSLSHPQPCSGPKKNCVCVCICVCECECVCVCVCMCVCICVCVCV